jgi:hypothetical protein
MGLWLADGRQYRCTVAYMIIVIIIITIIRDNKQGTGVVTDVRISGD